MSLLKFNLENKKTVIFLYKVRQYFDIGMGQISWVTGKIPEIMGALYILEKFEFVMVPNMIIVSAIICFVGITMLGIFMRKSGLWVRERKVIAGLDPVMNEIYEAAKKINLRYK